MGAYDWNQRTFGPAPAANADRSAMALDPMNAGLNVPEAYSTSLSFGSTVDDGMGAMGGIGSFRPPAQAAIDASRAGGAGGGMPDWMNWGNAGTALEGLGQLSSIYFGIQKNKLAKEALNFKKKAYTENMDFQKQSYNTALEDRINSRASFTGQDKGYVSSYLDKNRL